MESAIKAYSDVIAAVAKKQHILSLILQELIATEATRIADISAFVDKHKEKIIALKNELLTNSDLEDLNESIEGNDETVLNLIARQVTEVFDSIDISKEERASYQVHLWDVIAEEVITAINDCWKESHKED